MMKVAMMVWKERFCQKWLVREIQNARPRATGTAPKVFLNCPFAHLARVMYLYCNSSALSRLRLRSLIHPPSAVQKRLLK